MRRLTTMTGLLLMLGATGDAQEAATEAPAKTKKVDIAKKKRDLEVARLELSIAELKSEISLRGAENAVAKARRDLDAATEKLETFARRERPVDIEKAQIGHDRAAHSAEHALDELNELKAMYSAEEFAEMTKELVIKRGERRLEVARRELDVQKEKLAILKENELPRKQRELEAKVADAQSALEDSQLKLKQARLESQVTLLKARNRVIELEEALSDGAET